jgi:catechol 2,3-dioxygenase-like lactoylglutathione lyase family enzyme
MFTHVTVGANDIEASRQFYDAALGALGIDPATGPDPKGRYWWRTPRGAFAVGKPIDGEPACHANGGTIGFAAADLEAVAAFQAAGIAAGGTAIEDPSGNKICALHRVG